MAILNGSPIDCLLRALLFGLGDSFSGRICLSLENSLPLVDKCLTDRRCFLRMLGGIRQGCRDLPLSFGVGCTGWNSVACSNSRASYETSSIRIGP